MCSGAPTASHFPKKHSPGDTHGPPSYVSPSKCGRPAGYKRGSLVRVLVVTVNFVLRLFPFVSFPQTSEFVMTWGSPRASLYVKCVGYSEGWVPPACVESQEV